MQVITRNVLPLVAAGILLLGGLAACAEEQTQAQDIAPEATLVAVADMDTEPKVLNLAEIQQLIGYPKQAHEQGIEGTVIVRILVDKDGQYAKHEVLKEGHSLLLGAVEGHLAKLKFEPAQKEGKPVKFWVTLPFKFATK